jgi:hypothetical protein
VGEYSLYHYARIVIIDAYISCHFFSLLGRPVEVLTSPSDRIRGIHNTKITLNSHRSMPGNHYPLDEKPSNAIDGNVQTKYLNFGHDQTGLHSGFYVSPQKGGSILTAIQFTTGNDFPGRDPIAFSLEGSNNGREELKNGSSWNLICTGLTGLTSDPGRGRPGAVVCISNTTIYTSYRLLIWLKRNPVENCVQYSGCTLFGKIAVSSSIAPMVRRAIHFLEGKGDDDDNEGNERLGWHVNSQIPDFSRMRNNVKTDDDEWYIEEKEI